MFLFEICANSVRSCLAAQEGGAHRVELCAALPEGGTTPSYGEIIQARELLTTTRLHVIIRPRAGDFLYSELEIGSMLHDIELCRKAGVDGVVFGCLTPGGDIDMPLMRRLMAASEGLSVTFHRAFDMTRDPRKALDDIIELGCDRVLTSGQQPTAYEGMQLLSELQRQAAGRIILLAGSGVNPSNIRNIHELTGITEFHFSARSLHESKMLFRNPHVSMGGTVTIDEYQQPFTTAENVNNTIQQLK
jgi:copper homeostasis protein